MPSVFDNPAYGSGVVNPSGQNAAGGLGTVAQVWQDGLGLALKRAQADRLVTQNQGKQTLARLGKIQGDGGKVDPGDLNAAYIAADADPNNYAFGQSYTAALNQGPNNPATNAYLYTKGQGGASVPGVATTQQNAIALANNTAANKAVPVITPSGAPGYSNERTLATGTAPAGTRPVLGKNDVEGAIGENTGVVPTPPGAAPATPLTGPQANYAGQPIFTNLTPQQRTDANVPPTYTGAVQQSSTGQISAPGPTGVDDYTKSLSEGVGKQHAAYANGVEGAQQQLRGLNAMSGAIQRIQAAGGTTGMGAPETLKLQSALNSGLNMLGLPQMDISDKEFMTKFSRQIAAAATATGANGGRVTNFALSNMLQANPGLMLSPTGNVRLLGIMSQEAQRQIDIGQQIRQTTADARVHGRQADMAANERIIRSYDDQHHIMDPVTGQDLTKNPALPDLQGGTPRRAAESGRRRSAAAGWRVRRDQFAAAV